MSSEPRSHRARPGDRDDGRLASWAYVVGLLALDVIVVAWIWPTLTRPLWYDESWRAYHLSIGHGWFNALRSANAPLPLGWFMIERAFEVTFGNNALILRLPEILSLPAFTLLTYLLGRWWLARPAAATVAAAATVNGSLLVYGLQLKSYLPEAACAAGIVHLWLRARELAARGRSPLPSQLGLAACGVTALSSLFVLAPLLLIDVMAAVGASAGARRSRRPSRTAPSRSLPALRPPPIRPTTRRRSRWRESWSRESWSRGPRARLPGAILVAAVSAAHLDLFVLPQSYLTKNPYWEGFFLDSSTWASRLGTAGADLATRSVTAALTRPDGQYGSPFAGSPLLDAPAVWVTFAITVGVLGLWLAGVVAATRLPNGPALVLALFGAVVTIVIAGWARQWPVGFVRANLFLLPLLYVLAGLGATALVRTTGRAGALKRTACAVVLAWVALVIAVGGWRIGQIRSSADSPLLLGSMDKLVATEKTLAGPGDIQIVVSGRRDLSQWFKPQEYYDFYADETRRGTTVANDDTLLLQPAVRGDSIAAFLPRHSQARQLFLVTYNQISEHSRITLFRLLHQQGWCQEGSTYHWPLTGDLIRLIRCHP